MPTSIPDSDEADVDPDDAPRLTRKFFDKAEIREGGKLVRAGRTRTEPPREQISVRLDVEVLARLREHGPGWQSRMNPLLRQALGLDGPVVGSAEMRRVLEEIGLLRSELANVTQSARKDAPGKTEPVSLQADSVLDGLSLGVLGVKEESVTTGFERRSAAESSPLDRVSDCVDAGRTGTELKCDD